MRFMKAAGLSLALTLVAGTGQAADPVKIGFVTTLSGPAGYLGEDARDGFLLAIAQENGKLGGIPVELMVEDDGLKPGTGKQIVERMLKRDKARIISGTIFSNVANAIVPDVLDSGAFYISPNAAPPDFAGKQCHRNYFVTSWQNDNLHESAGEVANRAGFKNVFVLAPNYQAGKDAIIGFKRLFKGTIAGEIYTRLDQTDYAPELAQIRAARPDAVFQFLPGGLGINFYKQYAQAGLSTQIPQVANPSGVDERILSAIGPAAIGIKYGAHWDSSFDNPANKRMVADYVAKYNRQPTMFVAQGYDTARLIGSALKAVNGDMRKEKEFRAALEAAKFESVRGNFVFAANHHPIQDWRMMEIVAGPDGKLAKKDHGVVLKNHRDAYLPQCVMKN